MKLNTYEEIVGTLEKYTQEPDCIKLVFQIETTIELPITAIPKDELDDCICRKIAIFNNAGEYRLKKYPRAIDTFKEETCPSCDKRKQCSKDGMEFFSCLLHEVSELSRNKKNVFV